jgi:hypothetical protein
MIDQTLAHRKALIEIVLNDSGSTIAAQPPAELGGRP